MKFLQYLILLVFLSLGPGLLHAQEDTTPKADKKKHRKAKTEKVDAGGDQAEGSDSTMAAKKAPKEPSEATSVTGKKRHSKPATAKSLRADSLRNVKIMNNARKKEAATKAAKKAEHDKIEAKREENRPNLSAEEKANAAVKDPEDRTMKGPSGQKVYSSPKGGKYYITGSGGKAWLKHDRK
ncbi:MAG: hypothetical protein JSS76_08540 [Bacteroidetes bacterium]|nr:hypothetical protein [Bacteroidota bacterium]